MDQNFSIVSLVLGASSVVQVVLALLMAVSLASWTVIFRKYFSIKRARVKTDDFEQEFWSGTSLNDLYQAAVGAARHGSPLQRIFASGMREFLKLRERRLDASTLVDGARRAMRAAQQREMDVIESNLSFLASVASVSPYVGLFGTVWGIMHAFVGLSNLQQVTLATVGSASRAPDTVVEVDLHADKTLQVRLLDPKAKPGDPALQPQDVTAEALTQTVAQLASGAGGTLADMPVMIAADKRVEYDDVMKLLDRLKRAGVQRVGLAVAASGGR